MKIKIDTIVRPGFLDAFGKLLDQPQAEMTISYQLAKSAKIIEAEVRAFEQARLATVKKYGKLDAEGKNWQVEKDQAEAFLASLNELGGHEVEIPLSGPVKLSGNDKAPETSRLTGRDMLLLLDLLEPVEAA